MKLRCAFCPSDATVVLSNQAGTKQKGVCEGCAVGEMDRDRTLKEVRRL